jgi:GH24 family phage-related lysozyme (muramidase)
MALRMAQPWKDPKSGIFHLRQRTPLDLVERVKGTKVRFEIDGQVVVTVGNTVQVSLQTRDPVAAKARHAAADARLRQHWDAVRRVVVRLTHRDAVSLPDWIYRAGVGVFERSQNTAGSCLIGKLQGESLKLWFGSTGLNSAMWNRN